MGIGNWELVIWGLQDCSARREQCRAASEGPLARRGRGAQDIARVDLAGCERNLISGSRLREAAGFACEVFTTGGAVCVGVGLAAIPTNARQKITETANQNPSAINRTIAFARAMFVPRGVVVSWKLDVIWVGVGECMGVGLTTGEETFLYLADLTTGDETSPHLFGWFMQAFCFPF